MVYKRLILLFRRFTNIITPGTKIISTQNYIKITTQNGVLLRTEQ